MAVTISVDPIASPRVITVLAPDTTITIQQLVDLCRDWEDDPINMDYPHLINASGGEDLGGGVYVGLTAALQNAQLAFEARPGPAWVQCRIAGGNLVAVDDLGATMDTIFSTAFVQIILTSASSATSLNSEAIEYASFNGGVTINVVSGVGGTTYPLGTPQSPVNNLADAKIIATAHGFDTLFIKGDLTIGATDVVSDYILRGQGATLNIAKTTITMVAGCATSNTQFNDALVTGYQGGEAVFHDCVIDEIENAHCHFHRCAFLAPIGSYTMQQTVGQPTHISDMHECYSDQGVSIMDRNGTRVQFAFYGWSGRIKFINQNHATQSGDVWIHMLGGTVEIDTSCTKGAFYISGDCTVINNSGGSTVDVSRVSTSAEVWDKVDGIEASLTPRQAMRLISAALAGKISGAPTGPVVIRNTADTKDRISATVDANGNRTGVTTDLS